MTRNPLGNPLGLEDPQILTTHPITTLPRASTPPAKHPSNQRQLNSQQQPPRFRQRPSRPQLSNLSPSQPQPLKFSPLRSLNLRRSHLRPHSSLPLSSKFRPRPHPRLLPPMHLPRLRSRTSSSFSVRTHLFHQFTQHLPLQFLSQINQHSQSFQRIQPTNLPKPQLSTLKQQLRLCPLHNPLLSKHSFQPLQPRALLALLAQTIQS